MDCCALWLQGSAYGSLTNDTMENPYQATNVRRGKSNSRFAVMRYAFAAAMLLPTSVVVGLPALVLLNQEYGWLPTQSGIYEISFNGRTIANASVIWGSTAICIATAATAIFLSAVAFRNWQANCRLSRDLPTQ